MATLRRNFEKEKNEEGIAPRRRGGGEKAREESRQESKKAAKKPARKLSKKTLKKAAKKSRQEGGQEICQAGRAGKTKKPAKAGAETSRSHHARAGYVAKRGPRAEGRSRRARSPLPTQRLLRTRRAATRFYITTAIAYPNGAAAYRPRL